MAQEKIAILVDSCSDVPEEYRRRHHMYVAPMTIIYPDAEYRDGVDIRTEDVYAQVPAGDPFDIAAQSVGRRGCSSSRSRPTATRR